MGEKDADANVPLKQYAYIKKTIVYIYIYICKFKVREVIK